MNPHGAYRKSVRFGDYYWIKVAITVMFVCGSIFRIDNAVLSRLYLSIESVFQSGGFLLLIDALNKTPFRANDIRSYSIIACH